MQASPPVEPLSTQLIIATWWPLAASWLLMTSELTLTSAVIARLTAPEVNLAAWGIVFAVSILVQAPSVMLLAASTALCTDRPAYLKLRQIMLGILIGLTLLHALIAFTPLYEIVMLQLIGAPVEVVNIARGAFMLMLPWAFGTGYRRFSQGVLIRFQHSRAVIWGTLVRLSVVCIVLGIGYLFSSISGVTLAAVALILGVLSEALYTELRVRPVIRDDLRHVRSTDGVLTFTSFLTFYIPLVAMTVLTLLVQAVVSASLSRMPNALESLAVWPVITGFLMIWQSVGIAYNEVVISLLDRPRAVEALRQFTTKLALIISFLLVVVAVTPLAELWFVHVAALPENLSNLALHALWIGILVPGLRILQNWYQGIIVFSRATAGIMESVLIFLVIATAILVVGVMWGQFIGLYVGMIAFTFSFLLQTLWLRYRAHALIQSGLVQDIPLTMERV